MGVPMGEGAVEATRGTKRQAGDGRLIAPKPRRAVVPEPLLPAPDHRLGLAGRLQEAR
jgi:hypothetical protein